MGVLLNFSNLALLLFLPDFIYESRIEKSVRDIFFDLNSG
jgi:hypothetical protein